MARFMNRRLLQLCAIAAALFLGGLSARADTGGTKAAEKEKAKALTDSAAEVEKLKKQFADNRDAFLAERQKLIEKLRSATEEEKQKIQEQLQKQMDAMREYARQQRDDLRKQRPNGR